ncbi:hypothetical protein ACFL5P_00405 [candidate division KSB1 bacterium]
MDYLQFYDDETYLFETVRNKFNKNGYIDAYDFFSIIIWKANRAKSYIAKKLLRLGAERKLHTLDDAVKEITSHFSKPNLSDEEKLSYLLETWEFYLPMASAILTVLFPDEFTIYDYRVCEELNINQNFANWKFERLWPAYQEYIQKVKDATPAELSLRDKDRYLISRSYHNQLVDDIKNQFGVRID